MSYLFNISSGASQNRLEKLIAERLKPGTDKNKIDKRIWDLFGERWAIMFTDLSGFSRQVAAFGIIHFLQIIYESQRLFGPCIDHNDGILLKMEGDSMLVIFRNVRKAIAGSIAMQRCLEKYNEDRPDTEKIHLCIGLGFGEVLRVGDQDVFGAEVNAASKLGEDMAASGEIMVTGAVRDAARKISGLRFQRLPKPPSGAASAYKLLYADK